MTRSIGLALNVGVLAAFGYAVEHYWGWARLLAPWGQIAPTTIALAITGMLASYALRGTRIYLAEKEIPRGAWFACLRLILINNALNLILPARAGEVSFPVLMRRWFGIDLAQAAGTLFWLRLLDLHVLATVAAACAASAGVTSACSVSGATAMVSNSTTIGAPTSSIDCSGCLPVTSASATPPTCSPRITQAATTSRSAFERPLSCRGAKSLMALPASARAQPAKPHRLRARPARS